MFNLTQIQVEKRKPSRELKQAMYEPSSNWIQCGNNTKESLGMIHLEVLECKGLPNMDAGGALGNKTDAFVCAEYEENLVQTDVINDRLSPRQCGCHGHSACFAFTLCIQCLNSSSSSMNSTLALLLMMALEGLL